MRRLGHRPIIAGGPAGQAADLVAARVEDAFVRPGQRQPLSAERLLVLVEPVERIAFLRLGAGAGHVHAAEVHLAASLADRELDRTPAQEVQRARVRLPDGVVVAGVDRRQATAVAIEDQAREWLAPGIAGARLEIDEVSRAEGRRPPGDERRARTEREMAPLPGLEEEIVETIQGDLGGFGRGEEALPCPTRIGAGVMADDPDLGALGAADPLAGRLGDRLEDGRLVGTAAERKRDPVTRRLDLLDLVEPRGLDRAAEPGLRVGDLGVRGDDVDPVGREVVGQGDDARRECLCVGVDRSRPTRDVGAAATDERPRPGQRECPPTGVIDEEARPPARRLAMGRPGPRLIDVPAGRIDGAGVPVLELAGSRVAQVQSAAPYDAALPLVRDPAAPARPLDADALGELVRLPAERAEDQVPRPDVLDLATAEAGLEMGDAAGRQAPQVVARGARLTRRADGLPLEEVVGP